jgi:hypothetical protein
MGGRIEDSRILSDIVVVNKIAQSWCKTVRERGPVRNDYDWLGHCSRFAGFNKIFAEPARRSKSGYDRRHAAEEHRTVDGLLKSVRLPAAPKCHTVCNSSEHSFSLSEGQIATTMAHCRFWLYPQQTGAGPSKLIKIV